MWHVRGRTEVKGRDKRPRHRWKDNIKGDLKELGFEGADWIDLTHDRDMSRVLLNGVMNLWV